MKILITAPFDPTYLDLISQSVGEVIQGPPEDRGLLGRNEFLRLLNQYAPEVLVVEVNRVPGDIICDADYLRAIAVCRGGTDNVDVETATQRGLVVINAPGRNATAVAEMAIALMINLGRNIIPGAQLIQDRQWKDMLETCYALEGIELSGRVAGIIGVGAVGKEVAKRLKALEMRLLGHDPYVSQAQLADLDISMSTLEELMQESDFVILLAASTDETRGMIDGRYLAMMKPSAYFINMARASLVNESALIAALREKKIQGAALDVHSQEPLPADSPWLGMDNVLLTPHLGGSTTDAIRNHSTMIYEDLKRIADGKKPTRIVNPDVWSRRKRS